MEDLRGEPGPADVAAQPSWVVEQDPDAWQARDSARRAFRSATITLTLGVLGSSILPIPFAVSRTSVALGGATMVAVAAANDLTSCWLVRAAAATGQHSYEELAEWAGGRAAKVATQVCLIALLFGTMCGGLALISDVAVMLVELLYGSSGGGGGGSTTGGAASGGGAAGWGVLAGGGQLASPPFFVSGRSCMAAVAALVLFPLCMQRHMRELEKAAAAGVVMVALLIGLLAAKAAAAGFPALHDGGLQLWGWGPGRHLPEAFSVLGYAFYMQPMLMPLLQEMPAAGGLEATEAAVHVTLFGVALVVYFCIGLFGASLYGQATEGNILVNRLLTAEGPAATLLAAMLVYLCFGIATTQFALRASLDYLFFGPSAPFSWRGLAAMNLATIGGAVAVAWQAPHAAEKIFSFVGATAVAAVCYAIPVGIHLRLFAERRKQRQGQQHRPAAGAAPGGQQQRGSGEQQWQRPPQGGSSAACPAGAAAGVGLAAPLLGGDEEGGGAGTAPGWHATPAAGKPGHQGRAASWWAEAREVGAEVVLPLTVLVLGVGFSVAAVWAAALQYLDGGGDDGRRVVGAAPAGPAGPRA